VTPAYLDSLEHARHNPKTGKAEDEARTQLNLNYSVTSE
jgi:amidophosphoribosyltransferase